MDFQTINPATNKKINHYNYESDGDLEIKLHQLARDQNKFKLLPLSQRMQALDEVKKLLTQNGGKILEELALQMTLEMGKPIAESRAEVQKTLSLLDYYIKFAPVFAREQQITAHYSQLILKPKPLGIILGIMPWNFPVWQVMRWVVPNLLLGNAVLVKSAEPTAGVGEQLEKIFDVMENFLNLKVYLDVKVNHSQVSNLIADPRISGVTLTGSSRAGAVVGAQAGRHLKKCVLELGGSDAYVLWPDCDLEGAVEICVRARLVNNGQSCIAAKRFYVPQKMTQEFVRLLKAKVEKYKIGSPLDESVHLGPLSHEGIKQCYLNQMSSFKPYSLTWIETHCADEHLILYNEGSFVSPTIAVISDQVPKDLLEKEIFGPGFLVFPYESIEQVPKRVNDSPYGLGAAVFSRTPQAAACWAEENLQVGMIAVNDSVRSDARVPFGGLKNSGFGRELGEQGFYEFANWQWVGYGHVSELAK